jgi:hypothetical protein
VTLMPRNTKAIFILLGLLMLGAFASSAEEVPRLLYAEKGQPATFVRLDAVFTPEGRIDPSLFSSSEADTIRAYMQLPEEKGCVRLRGLIRDYVNARPLSSTEEASQKAKLILVGVVKAQAQGFSGSEAGTLLEIAPQEVLKGAPRKAESSNYVFFPIATFNLKGRSYCASNPDWPALPEVGDRLLVFIRNHSPSSNSYLPLLDGTDVIVLRSTGVELPPRFKAERAAKSLNPNGIIDKVRSYVESEQH